MNDHLSTVVGTLLPVLGEYQDLGNCMCIDDHGAKILAILNQYFEDQAMPEILTAVDVRQKYVPEPKDT